MRSDLFYLGPTGPGPLNADGTSLNPSSLWYTGMDRPLIDKMQQRMAQETCARIEQGIQLIQSSEKSAPVLSAKFEMAQRLRYGWGMSPDSARALKLYESAAQGGHPQAGYEWASLYAQGNMGVSKDLMKAKEILQATKTAYDGLKDSVKSALEQQYYREQLDTLESVVTHYQEGRRIGLGL